MDIAAELGRLIGPLRRAVLATRHAEGLPDLPEAQIELLRALQQAGTATPGEISTRLRAAPSTVSNLVRTMTAAGLVVRTQSATDLRNVYLSLSPAACEMLDRYDRVSTTALRDAMDRLSPRYRKALEAALPAIAELITALAERPPDAPPLSLTVPGRAGRAGSASSRPRRGATTPTMATRS
ncbi:MarR family winged helix-turn-helix transcriptional regulator [Mycobacterium sp. 1245852.3]|uniref:MarR family winged helix-turn-helix transcriptional regulator n=1 Tax=Mycobacterium sp. 1245852.3 TaxID=1856860 RepID=UPI0007FF8EC0|nr:MarR family transcriptional regulator [Mycobacterium sp. 1245852.3]OBJ83274.1 ArsR family transcriptional regulator [Mycobacterium sp. 1245852.3]